MLMYSFKKQESKLAREKHRQKTIEEKDPKDKQNGSSNSTNGERSDSVNSSAATSVGTATPPSMSGN